MRVPLSPSSVAGPAALRPAARVRALAALSLAGSAAFGAFAQDETIVISAAREPLARHQVAAEIRSLMTMSRALMRSIQLRLAHEVCGQALDAGHRAGAKQAEMEQEARRPILTFDEIAELDSDCWADVERMWALMASVRHLGIEFGDSASEVFDLLSKK